jgi:hypothetical protein
MSEEQGAKTFRRYLHSSQWDEALALYFGSVSEVQATRLGRVVLDQPTSRYENRLYRDLRFLARGIGDRSTVAPDFRREVGDRLLEALRDRESLNWKGLAEDSAYAGLRLTSTEPAILDRLADDDWNVRSAAVEFFVRAGAEDPETRQVFLQRLEDEDGPVRLMARLMLLEEEDPTDPERFRAAISDFQEHNRETSDAFDQLFATAIGRMIAGRPDLEEILFDAFRQGLPHFDLERALASATETEDRLRWAGRQEGAGRSPTE